MLQIIIENQFYKSITTKIEFSWFWRIPYYTYTKIVYDRFFYKHIIQEEKQNIEKLKNKKIRNIPNMNWEDFIFLKYPFKAKIQNNLKGITYSEINDIHYWKAEYTDENNH